MELLKNKIMEHCYLISYDLCLSGCDYDMLYQAIKRFPCWARLTQSLWAVVTTASTQEIRDYLLRYIDDNDRLLVIQSGRNAAWNNLIASSKWCKINLIK